MPLLIAGGDSFTWGSELPDQYMDHLVNLPSQLTWSARIAQHYGWDYSCVAKPGCGNNSITRRIIAEINKHPNEEIRVAVMWTYTHRSEIRLRNMKPYNTIVNDSVQAARFDVDDFWINLNAWHGLSFEEKMEYFSKDIHPERYEFFREQHDKLFEIGMVQASDALYKITGDYSYHNYNSLKEIMFLEMYCKQHAIPFFFCSASDELFKPQPPDVLKSGLYNLDWNHWHKDNSFYEWGKSYPQNGSHPGSEAHNDWVNLVLPKVTECFQK